MLEPWHLTFYCTLSSFKLFDHSTYCYILDCSISHLVHVLFSQLDLEIFVDRVHISHTSFIPLPWYLCLGLGNVSVYYMTEYFTLWLAQFVKTFIYKINLSYSKNHLIINSMKARTMSILFRGTFPVPRRVVELIWIILLCKPNLIWTHLTQILSVDLESRVFICSKGKVSGIWDEIGHNFSFMLSKPISSSWQNFKGEDFLSRRNT